MSANFIPANVVAMFPEQGIESVSCLMIYARGSRAGSEEKFRTALKMLIENDRAIIAAKRENDDLAYLNAYLTIINQGDSTGNTALHYALMGILLRRLKETVRLKSPIFLPSMELIGFFPIRLN